VDAGIVAVHQSHTQEELLEFDPASEPWPMRATLLLCPACKSFILGQQGEDAPGSDEWSDLEIVWPEPKSLVLDAAIPSEIRRSLREAHLCLEAGANIASAAMTGRAIEGVCRHYQTKSPYLRGGLQELKERGVIDGRLFRWGEELHWHRNEAAHAGVTTIAPEDAKDLFLFALAICEYVFVLSERFDEFMRRREANRARTSGLSQRNRYPDAIVAHALLRAAFTLV
jgi:hypothetical protein